MGQYGSLSSSLSVCLSPSVSLTPQDLTPFKNKVWQLYFYKEVLWFFHSLWLHNICAGGVNIILENGLGKRASNLGWACLHFTSCYGLWEKHEFIFSFFPPARQIDRYCYGTYLKDYNELFLLLWIPGEYSSWC